MAWVLGTGGGAWREGGGYMKVGGEVSLSGNWLLLDEAARKKERKKGG